MFVAGQTSLAMSTTVLYRRNSGRYACQSRKCNSVRERVPINNVCIYGEKERGTAVSLIRYRKFGGDLSDTNWLSSHSTTDDAVHMCSASG